MQRLQQYSLSFVNLTKRVTKPGRGGPPAKKLNENPPAEELEPIEPAESVASEYLAESLASDDTAVSTEEADVYVSASLSSKFDKFPLKLRQRLEHDFSEALSVNPVTKKSEYEYTVSKGHFVRCSNPRITTIVDSIHVSLAEANIALLSCLMASNLGKMIFTNIDVEEPAVFVEQGECYGLTYPNFLHVYMLRYFDLGWGFDDNGCLGFGTHVWATETNELKVEVWYVERVKVESEEK
ncbi:hypothetical protein BDV96DRAFT_246644 [Lophiotrema nucula]|uniref:Uncharacterized protein n=1 Tax=Lophiotrema nucula TaxID=690887 RepID=A0A6A5YPS8_9PLEO|nr:hypothetical protein BDV96DRAFT_246644 [Lophiotrema nucula]